MIPLSPEAQAAVGALIVATGLNQLEVEQRLWKLSFQVPNADRFQLTMMVLDELKREQGEKHTFAIQNPANLTFKAGLGWTLGEGLAQAMMSILFVGGFVIVAAVAVYIFLILMARV